ncbi:MAG TPA: response regulator [Candidatus Methylomirabilis sp.]|nr:response regulator [Candidatus Methylomirabilis sp.]
MTAKRILAVENNDLVLSFLEDGLLTAGYDVDTAHNGREALEMLDRAAYDVIISDVRMPELDGPGLREALATRSPEPATPFIFLTTPDSLDAHRSFLANTDVPALVKPVALEELRSTVERVITSSA